MKKMMKCMVILSILTSFASVNAQDLPSWEGVYKGTFIDAENGEYVAFLTLNNDKTYTIQSRSLKGVDAVSSGIFALNKKSTKLTLKDNATKIVTVFNVENDKLTKISENKKKVSSQTFNTMTKIQNGTITEKYWKLIELHGKAVTKGNSTGKEAHLIFKRENQNITGSGGCNNFHGFYELGNPYQLRFSGVASTLMACMNMEIEEELLKILRETDNYTLSADGKYLSLNRARMAPLARFEVVYLR